MTKDDGPGLLDPRSSIDTVVVPGACGECMELARMGEGVLHYSCAQLDLDVVDALNSGLFDYESTKLEHGAWSLKLTRLPRPPEDSGRLLRAIRSVLEDAVPGDEQRALRRVDAIVAVATNCDPLIPYSQDLWEHVYRLEADRWGA